MPERTKPFPIHCWLAAAALAYLGPRVARAEVALPAVASSRIEPELKGLVLIEELNCAACHATEAAFAGRSKKAPRLADVGSRVNPAHLQAFIANPHGVKPGTTMPDLLTGLGEDQRRDVANAITHFLLSLKPNDFSPQAPDAVAAKQGEQLFHSRGCVACHSPRDAKGNELLPATSIPLGPLDRKYSFKSLVEFLRSPQASRPSGRMPDLRLSGRDLERIAHYLLRDVRTPGPLGYTLYRGQVWEGLQSDEVRAERAGLVKDFALESLGRVEHHTAIRYEGWLKITDAGRYTFHLEMNGGSLDVDEKPLVQEDPSDRRGVKAFEVSADLAPGWRKIQLTYFHTGYDPKFTFEMTGPKFSRGPIPTSMLSVSAEPIPAFEPLRVDPVLAAQGREAFAKFGCARCHDDLNVAAPASTAFAKLDPARGCSGETGGPWPRFDLSGDQRAWIRAALPLAEGRPLEDGQLLNKTLVTFQCTACHQREGLGGPVPERSAYFTGTHEALGDQGRLPPPLTHVGAKLTPAWLADVLLHGKRQRDYLNTAMPQFGEANVGFLTAMFGKLDTLEAAPIAAVTDVQTFKNAGHEMMGSGGFSCIACHDFNGQKAVGAGALDIVHATERLQKNWFHLYLREPSRFHPTVIMPAYWPGGQSVRPNILGGDTARQIEALWTYLEDGVRAKNPAGLSRQARELRVTDVAEICRGQGPVGYRGIAVGYPSGVSLAFDAEQMSLRMLWKGEFANADLGTFEPRGHDRITFPAGIPFHRLKTPDENWPYKGKTRYTFPQDHGYQFRGYYLDALRRPTFMYRYGDVAVEDYFEDGPAKQGAGSFKRTLRFDAPDAQQPFQFRAAAGRKITRESDQVFEIDQLHLRITSAHAGTVREGEAGEVLITVTPPKGRSTLSLEYQW
jgi:cytochrome c553